MRTAKITRKTAETDITLFLTLEGTGVSQIKTGCGFLDHMLTLFAKHGRFDLTLACKGDTEVDFHHTTEDIGIALGQAFRAALGEGGGITRYADLTLPMDEALVQIALDISGRAYLAADFSFASPKVGAFDTELGEEFLLGFCRSFGLTLHLRQLAGKNAHHILEAAFKGLGRALRTACAIDPSLMGEIPSTKGSLFSEE